MSDKIKLWENYEFTLPFRVAIQDEKHGRVILDNDGNPVAFLLIELALNELAQLRQERDSLQKLSKRLSYVVAVCKNWDVFPLDGCDEVDEILDEPTVKAAIYDAHEFINSGVDAHLLCDKPKESL